MSPRVRRVSGQFADLGTAPLTTLQGRFGLPDAIAANIARLNRAGCRFSVALLGAIRSSADLQAVFAESKVLRFATQVSRTGTLLSTLNSKIINPSHKFTVTVKRFVLKSEAH
ncbi:hypothetical protein ACFL5U_03310 [Candidatus Margulisiibacteriota bacterium]